MTVGEYLAKLKGYQEKEKLGYKKMMWLAWHVGHFCCFSFNDPKQYPSLQMMLDSLGIDAPDMSEIEDGDDDGYGCW